MNEVEDYCREKVEVQARIFISDETAITIKIHLHCDHVTKPKAVPSVINRH